MNTVALQDACNFLDDWLEYQFKQTNLVGLSIAIHHKGSIVLSKTLGYADLSKKTALAPNHLFNIGSQSKMMTATAIMQLVEKGQVDLTDRAAKYLPWLSRHRDPQVAAVTIDQLLSHRAGIVRDGLEANFWQLEEEFPNESRLETLVLKSSVVTGDLRYKYSNIGYALLGLIIEKMSGVTYADYSTTHIINPLDLRHLHPVFLPAFEEHIAKGYTRPIGGRRLSTPTNIPTLALSPAAGWYATAEAMCGFMAAQFSENDSLLAAENKEWLHTDHRTHWTSKERRGKEYGSGFMIQNFGEGVGIGHVGSFIGHRSCSFYDPTLQVGVVVLANAKDAPVTLIAKGIFSVLYYFLHNTTLPCGPETEKFNSRLMNLWATVQIIATSNKIVAARLGEWLPLLGAEELEHVGVNTLRIAKADANASAHEFVTFNYQDSKVVSVNYAGSILRPESRFYDWLKNNWPNS
ncbi:MAG TPA: serine hydrolase domain-containing protein [Candidatus Saccharimonadales bacterium]|nr:serine hydrolase domain-containing protein [Candidatus Saccharimonadales bacterium]